MKLKEYALTEQSEHKSTIDLNNNILKIKYSSSNTREKPRNVKSNSDLNKYSRTVKGNNVFTSEICESHGKNRDIPRSGTTRRRSALGREDSSQLGSTRLRDLDSATLTRSTRARTRQRSAFLLLWTRWRWLCSLLKRLPVEEEEKKKREKMEKFQIWSSKASSSFYRREETMSVKLTPRNPHARPRGNSAESGEGRKPTRAESRRLPHENAAFAALSLSLPIEKGSGMQ